MNPSQKPYWDKLISNWCVELGRYGLTPPYLVGAAHKLQDRRDFNIKQLLAEIAGSNQKVMLSYCEDLDEFIIGLQKREYGFIGNVRHFGSLCILTDKLHSITTLTALTEFLEDIYGEKISQSLYSKDYDTETWADFTKEEVDEIMTICRPR